MQSEEQLVEAVIAWVKEDLHRSDELIAKTTIYHEPSITLNGMPAPPDAVVVVDYASGTVSTIVFEAKLRLDNKLLDQCRRWRTFSVGVSAVVPEPKLRSPKHNARRAALEAEGIGLMYITTSGLVLAQLVPKPNTRGRSLRDELVMTMATHGPKRGGIPGGGEKRVRMDRWEFIRAQLKDATHPLTLKELDFPSKQDRLQFAKAVDRGEVTGIKVVPYTIPREFCLHI